MGEKLLSGAALIVLINSKDEAGHKVGVQSHRAEQPTWKGLVGILSRNPWNLKAGRITGLNTEIRTI